MNKLNTTIIIHLIFILLFSLYLNKKSANVNQYTLKQVINYRMRRLERIVDSKILASKIYDSVLFWKSQLKPEPKIIEQPFVNRG